ncbi:MAG: hypothetical protein JXA67_14300, partial [Micromonosporaceae bacterium]|nr:hypothetical protein [Micromonosporaceae bacterium]
MNLRKLTAVLLTAGTLTVGSLVGMASPAAASDAPVSGAVVAPERLTADQMAAAVTLETTAAVDTAAATVEPMLACDYGWICGRAANGGHFEYYYCNTLYELPNLVGYGPLNNNQIPGTTAYFFDRDGYHIWPSYSVAP